MLAHLVTIGIPEFLIVLAIITIWHLALASAVRRRSEFGFDASFLDSSCRVRHICGLRTDLYHLATEAARISGVRDRLRRFLLAVLLGLSISSRFAVWFKRPDFKLGHYKLDLLLDGSGR